MSTPAQQADVPAEFDAKLARAKAAAVALVEAQAHWHRTRAEYGIRSAEGDAALTALNAANRASQRAWARVLNALRELEKNR